MQRLFLKLRTLGTFSINLHTKHANELAKVANLYEEKLANDLEAVEDAFTSKVCIAESIFQRKLDEEKDVSDKHHLKYKQYKDMWQTLKAKWSCLRLRRGVSHVA